MKKLSIFRDDEGIIVQRKNEFNTTFNSVFETTTEMLEHLQSYKNSDKIDEYELDVSSEFWPMVINFLNTGDIPSQHGGRREGAGRPAIGTTKKVSITLPDEMWNMIENLMDKTKSSRSEVFRTLIEGELHHNPSSEKIDDIYFVDEQHERNFNTVLAKWRVSKTNSEYMTVCYILSVPMIFESVSHLINDFKSPVDWIWRYLSWKEGYKEEWDNNYDNNPEYDEWIERKPFDLTSSMIQLGKFALNMWNSYEDFNLMNCMGSLDGTHYNVLKCAIDMRMGKFS